MPSITQRTNKAASVALVLCLTGTLLLVGCAHSPNQFREDGPSTAAEWDSPTAQAVMANVDPAEPTCRDWEPAIVLVQSGAVTHWPLWFEDPFVDKGAGRTDETHSHDVHRLGWEDYVAFPYCLARYNLNWLASPVSILVTPPFVLMESDGELSKQLLGYDHDAENTWLRPAPAPAEEEAEEIPLASDE